MGTAKRTMSKGMADALAAMDAAQLEMAKKAAKKWPEGPTPLPPPKLDVAQEKFVEACNSACGRKLSQNRCRLTEREAAYVEKAVRAAWAAGDRP